MAFVQGKLSCILKLLFRAVFDGFSFFPFENQLHYPALFFFVISFRCFVGDIDTGVVYSRKPTYLDSACVSADCTEANTLSVS